MSQAPHSHGMSGDSVPPVWPLLRQEELCELLRGFPQVGSLQAVQWHSPRPFSAAALVTTTGGQWFVKRHHRRVRTAAELQEEHGFIAHLDRQGCPVPQVERDGDGHSAIERDGWTYEVHARAKGADLYRDTQSWEPFQRPAHAQAAGLALARLHEAAQGYLAPGRQAQALVSRPSCLNSVNLLDAVEAQAERSPALGRYLAGRDWRCELALLVPLQRVAREHLRRQPPLWTHNDWHASNLLWNRQGDLDGVASVLDFGLCDRTCAIYDLATALERNAIAWLELDHGRAARADLATVDHLLAGYAQARPLTGPQVDALVAVLPMVHLDFALSEVAYFEGLLEDRANADLAWEGYLLRHARWFEAEDGQRLLGHLRERRGDWA
ncbi:phosphotransferase enzyme family protein [Pseudomonas sp. DC3200b2]|uniref:phosphotransferase enzyme family protein n=1 Tax=Pseudomonas sp. DC3200b2 TaxID=2804669 RepID=UPI003CEF4973